jgi:hypothetical protein
MTDCNGLKFLEMHVQLWIGNNKWQRHMDISIKQDRQSTYSECNTATRSSNHCCSGKAISITYAECVFIASVIKHVKSMGRIRLLSATGLAQAHFTASSHKRYDFRKNVTYCLCVSFDEGIWVRGTKYP